MTEYFSAHNPTQTVTLQDIADQCGVSRMTVSRALREEARNVSPETLTRIRAVAEELGYNPSHHHAARRLVMRRCGQEVLNHLIALYLPMDKLDGAGYYTRIFHSLLDVLREERFALATNYDPRITPYELPLIFTQGAIDGVLVLEQAKYFDQVLTQLRTELNFGKRPIVSMIYPHPGCSAIITDDLTGGRQAASHLLDLGHRHIICHAPEASHYPHLQRMTGFRQAFEERGLEAERYLHPVTYLDVAGLGDEQLVRELPAYLRAHPEVTAILAPYDLSAVRIWDCLTQGGWRIPDDISLMGYDDTYAIPDAHGTNLLTTTRIPLEEIGHEAATLILRRIARKQTEDITLTLPTMLIERSTTTRPHRSRRA